MKCPSAAGAGWLKRTHRGIGSGGLMQQPPPFSHQRHRFGRGSAAAACPSVRLARSGHASVAGYSVQGRQVSSPSDARPLRYRSLRGGFAGRSRLLTSHPFCLVVAPRPCAKRASPAAFVGGSPSGAGAKARHWSRAHFQIVPRASRPPPSSRAPSRPVPPAASERGG
jgi:hypothetical protein